MSVKPDLGEVVQTGDTVEIVFHRRYARPIEKVWAALTTPERLSDWFAQTTCDRLEVGGTLQLYFTGADYRSIARILIFDPPKTFAWKWSELDGTKASVVRFDLEREADGCRLTLTHSQLALDESPGVVSGWHAHLEAIEGAVDGIVTTWDLLMTREAEAKRLYEPPA